MWRYIFWKFITSVITLFLVVVLFYLIFVAVKGNPFESQRQSIIQSAGKGDGIALYNATLHAAGIDKSPIVRLGIYLSDLFHGNWGDVYSGDKTSSIPTQFFTPLSKSMLVAIPSYILGMILGLGLGFWAGYKRGKMTDVIINGFVTVFIAIPSFILAVFALFLAPLMGLPVVFRDSSQVGVTGMQTFLSLIMPILVMTLVSLGGWTYLTRIEVSAILKSDYVLAARTKGYTGWFIFKRYVLRNALYPFIGAIVTSFMVVFSSSLIVEKFFNINGVSQMLLSASTNGEINILMFNLIFFSGLGLFTQMLSDIAIFSINPIVKSNFSSKQSPLQKGLIYIKRRQAMREAVE